MEHRLRVGRPDRRAVDPHRRAGRSVRHARGSSSCPISSTARPSRRSPPTIDGFEAEADAFLAGRDGGRLSIAEAGAITFSAHLVGRRRVLARSRRHPLFTDLCADLVGPDVNLYWDQAVYKKPEKPRRFPWHQDNGYTFVEPQQYLTCWVALTDATVDNGCPQVVPGPAPPRHAAPPLRRPARLRVPRPIPTVPWPRAGAGRRRGRVLVADAAPHRAEHDRRRCARPTSSSTRPTAPRSCGATPTPGPPTARERADAPSASTPSSAAGRAMCAGDAGITLRRWRWRGWRGGTPRSRRGRR